MPLGKKGTPFEKKKKAKQDHQDCPSEGPMAFGFGVWGPSLQSAFGGCPLDARFPCDPPRKKGTFFYDSDFGGGGGTRK